MNNISLQHIALIYLAVINVVTFFVYGIDKWRSTSGRLLPTGHKKAKKSNPLCSLFLLMETLFKQMQSLNECVKCEGGAKHHRAAHGLVVVSPLFHEVCRWHKNDALPDIWRIVNIPHAGEYLAVMTDGLPKFIVVDGRLGKRLVQLFCAFIHLTTSSTSLILNSRGSTSFSRWNIDSITTTKRQTMTSILIGGNDTWR